MYWKKEEGEGDMNNDVITKAILARGYTRMVGARRMNMAHAVATPKPSMFLWCVAVCTYIISHMLFLKCLSDAAAKDRCTWELRCCNALQLVKHMRLTIRKRS